MIGFIILAAGKGSRMNMDMPKCSLKVLGKALINHTLDNIRKIEHEQIICVVGYQAEKLQEQIEIKNDITFVYQQEQRGTQDAVLTALKELTSKTCVIIPGDSPILSDQQLKSIISYHEESKNDITILASYVHNLGEYGSIEIEDGKVVKIIESTHRKKPDGAGIQNTGVYVFDTKVLKDYIHLIKKDEIKNEYLFTDIIALASQACKIDIYTGFDVKGVNTSMELHLLEEEVRKKTIDVLLQSGTRFANPSNVRIGVDVQVGRNVEIGQGCEVLGNSVIADNVTLGPNCQIIDSYIGEGSYVNQSVIEKSIVGKGNKIGPFAHIRENSVICDNVRIGNFVEIKKSEINRDTKAAHLTYIGDTKCGEKVNFGCGVITCNYDGKKKNETIIKDNVFIGSNCNLIAPITINSNSFIAAGTTVTSNVEEGEFIIGRVRQSNIKKP